MNKLKKKINNIVKLPRKTNKIERQIEAILFAADEPLDAETIEKEYKVQIALKKF